MIDAGTGPAVVLIPGLQGRCEWLQPTVDALAGRHRVLSFSLHELDPDRAARPFDVWTDGLDRLLATAGVDRAALVGVSFGGLIAMTYAARRPDRASALVLASTPAPDMALDPASERYLRHPRRSLPQFAVRAARRMWPETMSARRTWPGRAGFILSYAVRAVRYPVAPDRMAGWVRAWQSAPLADECRRVRTPALLVTGERHLDRVVPIDSTREYLRLIPGSRHVVLAGTGHVGFASKPEDFATVVSAFLANPGGTSLIERVS